VSCFIYCYAECYYSEHHYADCRYPQCRLFLKNFLIISENCSGCFIRTVMGTFQVSFWKFRYYFNDKFSQKSLEKAFLNRVSHIQYKGHSDTKYNDTHHNIQHNDTQHKALVCVTQRKDTDHNKSARDKHFNLLLTSVKYRYRKFNKIKPQIVHVLLGV
jgi:hypothetical protein